MEKKLCRIFQNGVESNKTATCLEGVREEYHMVNIFHLFTSFEARKTLNGKHFLLIVSLLVSKTSTCVGSMFHLEFIYDPLLAHCSFHK
jgi:hypothetical protein